MEPEELARHTIEIAARAGASAAEDSEEKIALARRCEEAALRHDPRINNSEGSGFSDALIRIAYCNSLGVCESYCKTVASLYACPLAELDGLKQRDYWLTTHVDIGRASCRERGHIAVA